MRRLVDAAPVVPVDKVGTAPAILFEQSRRRRAQVLSAAESRGSSKPQTSKLLRRSATRDLRGRRRTSRPAARFACSGGSAERMALSGRVRATNRRAWRKRCRPDQGQLLLRRRRGPRRRAASRRRPRCARPRSGPCLLRALQSPYVHGSGWLEPKRAGTEQEERGRAKMPSRGASRSAEFAARRSRIAASCTLKVLPRAREQHMEEIRAWSWRSGRSQSAVVCRKRSQQRQRSDCHMSRKPDPGFSRRRFPLAATANTSRHGTVSDVMVHEPSDEGLEAKYSQRKSVRTITCQRPPLNQGWAQLDWLRSWTFQCPASAPRFRISTVRHQP